MGLVIKQFYKTDIIFVTCWNLKGILNKMKFQLKYGKIREPSKLIMKQNNTNHLYKYLYRSMKPRRFCVMLAPQDYKVAKYANVLKFFHSPIISIPTKVNASHLKMNITTEVVVQEWSKLTNKKHLLTKTYIVELSEKDLVGTPEKRAISYLSVSARIRVIHPFSRIKGEKFIPYESYTRCSPGNVFQGDQ